MENHEEFSHSNITIPRDWRHRLLTGLCGGMTIASVRLVHSHVWKFDEGEFVGAICIVAFLVLISIIWSIMSDEQGRFKLYISAIAAPSMMIALFAGPFADFPQSGIKTEESRELSAIPDLSSDSSTEIESRRRLKTQNISLLDPVWPLVLVKAAHDQDSKHQNSARSTQLESLPQGNSDLGDAMVVGSSPQESFFDGVRATWVGKPPPSSYFYIVGKIDQPSTQTKVTNLSKDLARVYGGNNSSPEVRLIKYAENDETYFVAIGEVFPTEMSAKRFRLDVLTTFNRARQESYCADTLNILRNGIIANVQQLKKQR